MWGQGDGGKDVEWGSYSRAPDEGWGWSGHSGGSKGEKRSHSRYILNLEPGGFPSGLNVRCEEKKREVEGWRDLELKWGWPSSGWRSRGRAVQFWRSRAECLLDVHWRCWVGNRTWSGLLGRGGNINLGEHQRDIFKALRPDEITKGLSADGLGRVRAEPRALQR